VAGGRGPARSTGGVMAAIIIVLLLLLAVGFYYWQLGYNRRVERLESIVSQRRAMEEEARILVHMGVLGNATGENLSLVIYNGAPFPLTMAALVLVTTGGSVDVINSTHTPSFVTGAEAYLYRLTGQGLVLVESYPSLEEAIASGLTIPHAYLLEVNITATQPLDGLRAHAAFKAPLAGAGVSALIPISIASTAIYTSPAQAATGGGGGAPPATTTTTTTTTSTATTPPGACYIPVTITNNAQVSLQDYPVRIILNSTNINQTIWQQLNESKIYVTLDNGQPLYYYIEYFNQTEKVAVIWVKIPSLGAGQSIGVRIYYNYTGDNPYASYNDPYQVFTYYNPGNTLNFDWYPYDNYTLNYENIGVVDGISNMSWYVIYSFIGNSVTEGEIDFYYIYNYTFMFALKNLSTSTLSGSYGYCIDSLVNFYYIEPPEAVGVSILYTLDLAHINYIGALLYYDPYGVIGIDYTQGFKIIEVAPNRPPNVSSDEPWTFDDSTWYHIELCLYEGNIMWRVEYPNASVVVDDYGTPIKGVDHETYVSSGNYAGLLGGLAEVYLFGIPYYAPSHFYKEIYVRPFVYPEPSYVVGSPVCG